jgi:hypothetical protein
MQREHRGRYGIALLNALNVLVRVIELAQKKNHCCVGWQGSQKAVPPAFPGL